ncbi:unnamed protein product [Arctia plantaginis]|uniref:Zinc finger PHD-type domain-containing protein n=1 Tax=Arctia plantaginis TaxID=874455 RepID=A0A8S0Z2M2_ARCPL|nr:unnamed protein product [Arctia plantaginis]
MAAKSQSSHFRRNSSGVAKQPFPTKLQRSREAAISAEIAPSFPLRIDPSCRDFNAARCQKCIAYYHRRCVALPTSGTISTSWQCPECRKNQATDNEPETPVRGSGSYSLDASETPLGTIHQSPPLSKNSSLNVSETTQNITAEINSELRIFRDTLRSLNKDLQVFREMTEIRASLNACNGHLNKLEGRVSALEQQKPAVQASLVDIVEGLKQELNDRDQLLLADDVEIANLPEAGEENPIHATIQIAVKLGVQLEERDIVSAERVGPRRIRGVINK